MPQRHLTLAAAALAAVVVLTVPGPALAQSGGPAEERALSPYWRPVISRWEPIILHYAEERRVDPDLVAAVIWKESHGIPTEHSVVGAVGLMQLMPHAWRPSPEELEDPWTNLHWGVRALAQTIRDGNGDLYYSLAAFNGGWKQIHLRVTRRYAASVLDSYARAVAVRHGLLHDGEWLAIFAVDGIAGPNTITVVSPQRPLARYTERPWIEANVPSAPAGAAPHTVTITFVDGQGDDCRVNVWLVAEDGSPLEPSVARAATLSQPAIDTSPPSSQLSAGSGGDQPQGP